ncbi:DUF523 domain-containing protein [Veillonella intestinalis]|uniref:DUF523 domain-containing protein n=1 Tax=Veillonella intestinalis TaxID=2941341 RepID=UPI00203E7AF6|nr:DUF523 domain-containing protein [Veillonella intestinalis]
MKILCSACLLGETCKYNGGHNYSETLARYIEQVRSMAKSYDKGSIDSNVISKTMARIATEGDTGVDTGIDTSIDTITSSDLDSSIYTPVEIIPVCPEVLGGLPTPRTPAEIVNGEVLTRDGHSVDKAFREGALKALEIALAENIDVAILQSRSPSCGVNEIYDGTFSGTRIAGSGIFASLLKEHGIEVIDVEDLGI